MSTAAERSKKKTSEGVKDQDIQARWSEFVNNRRGFRSTGNTRAEVHRLVADLIKSVKSQKTFSMTPEDCAQWIMFKMPMALARKLQKKIINQPLKSEAHLIRLITDTLIE